MTMENILNELEKIYNATGDKNTVAIDFIDDVEYYNENDEAIRYFSVCLSMNEPSIGSELFEDKNMQIFTVKSFGMDEYPGIDIDTLENFAKCYADDFTAKINEKFGIELKWHYGC